MLRLRMAQWGNDFPAGRHRLAGAIGVAIGLALLVGALAGCGQTVGGTPQNCGTVQLRGAVTLGGTDATRAESCFYHAYQQCQRASLAVNEMGVDAGTDRTFNTQAGSNGGCAVSDAVYTYVIPTNHTNTKTYTCAGLSQKENGLLFSGCGADGDVFVPAAASGTPASTPAT